MPTFAAGSDGAEEKLLETLPRGIDLPGFLRQSSLILESHRFWFKMNLVFSQGSIEEQALRLFVLPQVVLSSDNELDPRLNYGNRQALTLWESSWDTLNGLPGRLTAEPMEQNARDAFLKRVRDNGFIADYEGIRVSRQGRRFWISGAKVWNVLDSGGSYLGQAATFDSWKYLS